MYWDLDHISVLLLLLEVVFYKRPLTRGGYINRLTGFTEYFIAAGHQPQIITGVLRENINWFACGDSCMLKYFHLFYITQFLAEQLFNLHAATL